MRLSRFKFRAIALGLLFILLLALCGCGETSTLSTDETPPETLLQAFTENVNGTEWIVAYREDTKEIVGISTAEEFGLDTSSKHFEFAAQYFGDSGQNPLHSFIIHSVSLTGTPLGDDWYKIEKTERYIMPNVNSDDWERVKETYPSCSFDANGLHYGEQRGEIILVDSLTRYEEKIVFVNKPN